MLIFQVIVTERAGHAYDTLSSLSDKELKTFDGVVAVV
jgi:ceramide kinase